MLIYCLPVGSKAQDTEELPYLTCVPPIREDQQAVGGVGEGSDFAPTQEVWNKSMIVL